MILHYHDNPLARAAPSIFDVEDGLAVLDALRSVGLNDLETERLVVMCYPITQAGECFTDDEIETLALPPDSVVEIFYTPQGGEGGLNFRTILLIAVSVAAPHVGGWLAVQAGAASTGVFASVAAGAFAVGSFFVINKLLPIRPPSRGNLGNTQERSPTYSFGSGRQNTARIGQAIPYLAGEHYIICDSAGESYIAYEDDGDEIFYTTLAAGVNNMEIERVVIGDTPIDNYDDIYYYMTDSGRASGNTAGAPEDLGGNIEYGTANRRVLTNIRTSRDVSGQELPDNTDGENGGDDTWLGFFGFTLPGERMSLGNTSWIILNFTSPALYHYSGGEFEMTSIDIEIELSYKNTGGTTTTETYTETISGDSQSPVRKTFTIPEWNTFSNTANFWANATGEDVMVRVRRLTAISTDADTQNNLNWAGLAGQIEGNFIFPCATIGIAARATNQLNSTNIRQFGVVARGKGVKMDFDTRRPIRGNRDINTGIYEDVVIGSNPANIIYDIMTRIGATPDVDFDTYTLAALGKQCESDGIEFNGVFDSQQSIWAIISAICSVADASPYKHGDKVFFSVSYKDKPAVAAFTPYDVVNITWRETITLKRAENRDAIEVEYVDENSLYRPASAFYPLDYGDQIPQTTHGFGITKQAQAEARAKRLFLRQKHQPALMSFKTERKGLIMAYGDVILFPYSPVMDTRSSLIVAVDNAGFSISTTAEQFDPDGTYSGELIARIDKADGSISPPLSVRYNLAASSDGSLRFDIAEEAEVMAEWQAFIPDIILEENAEDWKPSAASFFKVDGDPQRYIITKTRTDERGFTIISVIKDNERIFDE